MLGEGLDLSLFEEGRCLEYQWAVNGKTKEEKESQHRYRSLWINSTSTFNKTDLHLVASNCTCQS